MDDWDDTDYYAALGVDRTASPEDIKRAFRVLARQLHPDMHPQEWGAAERANATEHLETVLRGWEVLKDPERRARYDAHLRDVDLRREREAAAAAQRREWERVRAMGEYERARRAARSAEAARPSRPAEVDYDALEEAMAAQAAYWAAVLESLTRPQRGADVYCAVELDERTWRAGHRLRLPVSGVEVVIDPFVEPGWYAYRGLGEDGEFGGEPGDLYLAVQLGFARTGARVVRVRPVPGPTATGPAPARPSGSRPGPTGAPVRRRRSVRAAYLGAAAWSLVILALAVLVGVVLSRLLP